jgi:hypothetical protein
MKLISFLAPAILCAVISFQALLFTARTGKSWSLSLFYAFLPACFLLLAGVLVRQARDISRLRRRIARLDGSATHRHHSRHSSDTSLIEADQPAVVAGAHEPSSVVGDPDS